MRTKIALVVSLIMFWASIIALGWIYDFRAVAIGCAGYLALVGVIVCDNYEENVEKPQHSSCNGCVHDLGGGRCRMNLEYECREGGGFEMWEEDDDETESIM